MSINKVTSFPVVSKSVSFKSHKCENEYENPISRSTERNLAILSSVGVGGVVGAVVGGLTSCFGFKTKSVPFTVGAIAGAITFGLILPANLYNAKVNAFARQKEMDVFTRDRSLKTNLTEEVDKEVQNSEVSLDKKLDDNLKLQTANRGSALIVTGVDSKTQETKPESKKEATKA